MVGYIFTFLAAFFNACMDAFENENFFESIFKNWNQKFWYKRESWKYAKKIGGYHVDAWHLSKSLMVLCVVLALSFGYASYWWLAAIIWNLSFKIFYNWLFKIK
jgi:hypothetical protein